MKLSVSLSSGDVEFIDQYAAEHGVESRSGVVQRAVALLRVGGLGDDYAAAWDEWETPRWISGTRPSATGFLVLLADETGRCGVG